MTWIGMLAAIALAPPAPGVTQGFLDGAALQDVCATQADSMEHAVRGTACLAYVVGVTDQILLAESDAPQDLRSFCLPPGTVAEDLRAAVELVLAREPISHEAAAASVVAHALAHRFPCGAADERIGARHGERR